MTNEGTSGTHPLAESAVKYEAVGLDYDGKVKPINQLTFEIKTSPDDLDFWKPRIVGE